MIMIQSAYPHYSGGGQQLSPIPNGTTSLPTHHPREQQQHSPSPPPSSQILHRLSHSPHRPVPLRHRSVSPQSQIIYRPEPIFTRPTSPPPSPPPPPSMHKYDIGRVIKRCNSVDEEFYPTDNFHHNNGQIIIDPKGRSLYTVVDLEPRHEHYADTVIVGNIVSDDRRNVIVDEPELPEEDDLPLDLSLPVGRRRRDRTYSDSESDDSGGPGEEKTGDKAAYKKSLMKRYCKYILLLFECNFCFFFMFRYPIPHMPI